MPLPFNDNEFAEAIGFARQKPAKTGLATTPVQDEFAEAIAFARGVPARKPFKVDDDSWNITRGLKSGLWSTAAVAPAVGAMAAKTLGWEGGAKAMSDAARSLMERAEQYQPDTSFGELIKDPSLGGAVDWALFTIGNFAPSMMVGFGGAGVGAKVATKLYLKNAIKRGIARGLTKEAAAKAVTDQVMKKVALRGAQVGIVGSTGQLEGGHMFMGDVERHGIEDASVGKAVALGGLAGLVELGIGGFGKGHMRLIEKYLGKSAKREAIKQPRLAIRMLDEIGRQSGGEAFQELTQEELAILHEAWTATPEEYAEHDHWSKENWLRRFESGAGGALIGIPGGMITPAITRGTPAPELTPEQVISEEPTPESTLTNITAALKSGEITTDDVMNFAQTSEAQEEGIVDDLNALVIDAKVKEVDEIAKPPDVAPSAKDILTEGEDVTARDLLKSPEERQAEIDRISAEQEEAYHQTPEGRQEIIDTEMPTPAEPKVEIPDFKRTQEAYAFGEKATPEQVKELQRLVKVQDAKFNELKKAGKLQEAMNEAVIGQFYNEALQKVEGTEQYKKFNPEKAVAGEKVDTSSYVLKKTLKSGKQRFTKETDGMHETLTVDKDGKFVMQTFRKTVEGYDPESDEKAILKIDYDEKGELKRVRIIDDFSEESFGGRDVTVGYMKANNEKGRRKFTIEDGVDVIIDRLSETVFTKEKPVKPQTPKTEKLTPKLSRTEDFEEGGIGEVAPKVEKTALDILLDETPAPKAKATQAEQEISGIEKKIDALKAEREDWQTRKYKPGKKKIILGEKYDDMHAPEMSVGAINENRRKKTVTYLTGQIQNLLRWREYLKKYDEISPNLKDIKNRIEEVYQHESPVEFEEATIQEDVYKKKVKPEPKKVPKTETDIKPQISKAYFNLSKGEPNVRVRLADLFAELDMTHEEFSRTLKEMQADRQAILYPYNLPSDIKTADREAAVEVGGDPAHIIFMDKTVEPQTKDEIKEPWKMGKAEYRKSRGANAPIETDSFALFHLSKIKSGKPGLSVEENKIVFRDGKGDPIGVTTLRLAAGEKVVDNTSVHPSHRRKGIATKLYRKAKELGYATGWVENIASANAKHKIIVEDAQKAGKTIPENVLAEYPELTEKKVPKTETKAEEVTKPFEPDFKTMPLGNITVETKGLSESGQTIKVKENAKKALEQTDSELSVLQKILNCL